MPAPLVADLLALAALALALAEPVWLPAELADADVETAEPATRREVVIAAEAALATAELAATVVFEARAALTDEDHCPVIWLSLIWHVYVS